LLIQAAGNLLEKETMSGEDLQAVARRIASDGVTATGLRDMPAASPVAASR
jgi:cell division protease FtsH